MNEHIDQVALVTLMIAIFGVIYHAGRLSARVDYLERSFNAIPDQIVKGFDRIAALIRGEER